MDTESMTKRQAYDQARQEFYDERLRQDVERRVAKEEAESTGAYFGKSMLAVGMELEDVAYDEWRAWADNEVTIMEQNKVASNAAASVQIGAITEGEDADSESMEQAEVAVETVAAKVGS